MAERKRVIKNLSNDRESLTNNIDPILHLMSNLRTGPDGYEYFEHYIQRLHQMKVKGEYIDWSKVTDEITEFYSCTVRDLDGAILDLFYAGQYLDVCRDYARMKDLPNFAPMEFN